MTSITIVDIQDTNPQTENFDTVRSIDVDQEGFIEADRASDLDPDEHRDVSGQAPNNDNDMDDIEMSPQVKMNADNSVDHGIPSEALIEAIHPEQQSQLQVLNENKQTTTLAPSTSSANPFSPPPAVATLSRRTTSHSSSGPVYNNADDHYDDSTTNDNISSIGATKRTCLRRKASKEGGRNNNTVYNEVPTSDDSSASSGNSERVSGGPAAAMGCGKMRRLCRDSSSHLLRTTVSVMNFFARALLYGSVVSMIIGVVWYSRELKLNGTDPHLIAWFSAGAFVLLGFPISMCGIFMHLTNYYQPNVQCYVVRILWMVPIYSIQSWLCLRYINVAIYIETLRDFYESYVLYSFFQFLVEVLQGEEQLTLMLKDKSPTRGVHMWGLQWCVKPWLMGQPVSRRVSFTPDRIKHGGGGAIGASALSNGETNTRPIKRVEWTSPFFIKCKFGVLQYVLLKFVSAIFVMVLEMYGLYKEGDFTPKGGYLYICILTNLSQCWALYCLIFFYYALKNELGPIRPVGKFLSVKALVFFTWWQSLGISILAMMGLIPHYTAFNTEREWTSEAVAKGMQDWLICIEMFVAAIVHTFVFPHTDYLEPLNLVNQGGGHHLTGASRRVGRRGRFNRRGDDKSACSKNSGGTEPFETLDVENGIAGVSSQGNVKFSTVYESDTESAMSGDVPRHQRQGFVRALIDSTLPRDVLDESGRIFKGEFNVEKKSLLHHAVTSDEYDLFAKSTNRRGAKSRKARSNNTSEEVPNSILM
eukprot:scaffold5654_cov141-Skeletonema_menzelii.AAC.2